MIQFIALSSCPITKTKDMPALPKIHHQITHQFPVIIQVPFDHLPNYHNELEILN